MLLELAIGDAYGAGFEFVPGYMTDGHRIGRYQAHPTHLSEPGKYTDDTQMSIAVAELMLSGQAFTRENLAHYFVTAFKRDPRQGYAGGFYRILNSVENGTDLLQRLIPTSDKNGGAMRAAPVGLYPRPEQVVAQAEKQAKVTHNTPQGIGAAVAAALMVHYFYYSKGLKKNLPDYLYGFVQESWHQPWQGPVDVKAMSCVRAAVSVICESHSLTRILERCIQYGGDTDTTAAIALAGASCCSEINLDLPENLYEDLESGLFGIDYIRGLDAQLINFIRNNKGL